MNVSPKGMPSATFTIFDANSCAYVDATGSGAETIAHIYENGRVTLCWCSFDSTPRILRFYCTGSVVEHDSAEFLPLLERMGVGERVQGARAIIVLKVWKVGTSCGMSVPLLEGAQSRDEEAVNDSSKPMETVAARHFTQRESLRRWATNMEGKDKITGYRQTKNTTSLDGLPGLRVHRRERGFSQLGDVLSTAINGAMAERRGVLLGSFVTVFMMYLLQLCKKLLLAAALNL